MVSSMYVKYKDRQLSVTSWLGVCKALFILGIIGICK